jgi:fatty acid desaturase
VFGCVGFFLDHSFAKETHHIDGQLLERYGKQKRSVVMLWTLALILVVLWLLGIVTSYTAGGLIHILLVVALVVIVIRLFQGRQSLT